MIRLGDHLEWTKSTYSTGENNCVEVRSITADAVDMTDSKLPTSDRPTVRVSAGAFSAFARTL